MTKTKRTLLSMFLAFIVPHAGACDELRPEDGVFVCDTDDECPNGWICEPREEQSQARCWKEISTIRDASTKSSLYDARAFEDTPERSGGRSYPDLDAETQYPCGDWKRVTYSDRAPRNAESLGHEYDPVRGPNKQYVCKFEFEFEGRRTTLQGKGAFNYGCFAAEPASATRAAQRRESARFDVLVDTSDCARMGPFDDNLRLMPTGVDAQGMATFSCRAGIPSPKVPGKEDLVLGRFDPVTRVCSFVVGDHVVEQTEEVEALMVP